jgi:hypothetical protein
MGKYNSNNQVVIYDAVYHATATDNLLLVGWHTGQSIVLPSKVHEGKQYIIKVTGQSVPVSISVDNGAAIDTWTPGTVQLTAAPSASASGSSMIVEWDGTNYWIVGGSETVAGVAGVATFNTRGGAITLTSSDVTAAGGTATLSRGVIGTTTNDNAAAGNVGEYIESMVLIGAAVSLTTATPTNVVTITLTAGDWDVHGAVAFHSSGTTNVNDVETGLSTVSNTLPTDTSATSADVYMVVLAASPDISDSVGTQRISIAAPTTLYLVTNANFSISTLTAYGKLCARRRR